MPSASTYDHIASTTLSSSGSTVTFSNIPQNYTDLILIGYSSDSTSGTSSSNVQIRFNGNTDSGYLGGSGVSFLGTGVAANAFALNNISGIWAGYQSSASGIFGTFHLDIMGYSQSDVFKCVLARAAWGVGTVGVPRVEYAVNTWRDTRPITSMVITGAVGFAAGTQWNLYGIKAA